MEKEKEKEKKNEFKRNENKEEMEKKIVWKKIRQLQDCLHRNDINDKKSACFYCSYEFDTPAIYLPKMFLKSMYHVYGCFCTPECAAAYLMTEKIDESTKFERYGLLNSLYGDIFEYSGNIKPAPDPHFLLDKFYGNLSIEEYRGLFKLNRHFLILNKPLIRILPELHDDNDDFLINNKKNIFSSFLVGKNKRKDKTTSFQDNFGILHCLKEIEEVQKE